MHVVPENKDQSDGACHGKHAAKDCPELFPSRLLPAIFFALCGCSRHRILTCLFRSQSLFCLIFLFFTYLSRWTNS